MLLQNINSILKEKARTSVFVAHRLRTIYDSNMIIVLQDGNVAENGTHDELIEAGGLYADLWRAQETSSPMEGTRTSGSLVEKAPPQNHKTCNGQRWNKIETQGVTPI